MKQVKPNNRIVMQGYPKVVYYLIVGLVFFGACKSTELPSPRVPLIAVHTATVALAKSPTYEFYPAIVVPMKEVLISAQVGGYVMELGFQDGDLVRKGQLLYKIDSTIYLANLQSAIANLHIREAELDKANKDLLRYRELFSQQAIAQQQLEYAESAYVQMSKMVEAARASVKAATSNLSFTKIYAPFTGTIGISHVRVGSNVIAGQSILNTLSTNNPMYIDFFVEQSKLAQIREIVGKRANPFELYIDGKPYAWPAKLALIDRALDQKTASIKLRLSLNNSQGLLKAGMNVSVRINTQAQESALTIPHKAVTPQMGEFYVYILQEDSTIRQEYVHLGAEVGDKVIVKSGLKEGDEIVIDGLQKLKNGMKIRRASP